MTFCIMDFITWAGFMLSFLCTFLYNWNVHIFLSSYKLCTCIDSPHQGQVTCLSFRSSSREHESQSLLEVALTTSADGSFKVQDYYNLYITRQMQCIKRQAFAIAMQYVCIAVDSGNVKVNQQSMIAWSVKLQTFCT